MLVNQPCEGEYVETSDPEELEVQATVLKKPCPLVPWPSQPYTPRKRLKLHHQSSPLTSSSIYESTGAEEREEAKMSMTRLFAPPSSREPNLLSSGSSVGVLLALPSPQDSTNEPPVGIYGNYNELSPPDNGDACRSAMFERRMEDYLQEEFRPDVYSPRKLDALASSQDPLDMIHRRTNPPPWPPRQPLSSSPMMHSGSFLEAKFRQSLSLSPQKVPGALIPSSVSPSPPLSQMLRPIQQPWQISSPALSKVNLSCHAAQLVVSPMQSVSSKLNPSTEASISLLRETSLIEDPGSALAVEQLRRSNLPESQTVQVQDQSDHDLVLATNAVPEGNNIVTDDGLTRYPLRVRQAKQLNPYQYEKIQYKRQLRGNPDAIVKVTSPARKQAHLHVYEESKESGARRSWNEESQDDEWSPEPENNEESQTQTQGPSIVQTQEAVSQIGDNRNVWLPDAFDLSDDELPPLSPWKSNVAEAKPSRRRRRRRFPMREAIRPVTEETSLRHTRRASESDGAPYSRQTFTPIRRGHDSPSVEPSSNYSEPRNLDHHDQRYELSNIDADRGTTGRNAYTPSLSPRYGDANWLDLGTDMSGPMDPPHDTSTGAPGVIEIISLPSSPFAPHGDLQNVTDHSLTEDEFTGTDTEVDEEDDIDRKRLKTLSKIMPRVMIPKALRQNSTKSRPAVHVHTSSGEDEEIRPGQSKTRRVAAHTLQPLRIEGDPESSDDSHSESESEVDALEVTSGSEGEPNQGVDEELFESTWFGHNYDQTYHGSARSGKGESLIDRMLSRTVASRKTSTTDHKLRRHHARHIDQSRPRNPALDIRVAPNRPKPRLMRKRKLADAMLSLPSSSGSISAEYRNRHVEDTSTTPNELTFDFTETVVDEEAKRRHRKERLSRKQRRQKVIEQQTYLVPSDGRVLSIAPRRRLVKVDMRDDGFHTALAPLVSSGQSSNHIRKHASYAKKFLPEKRLRQTHLTEDIGIEGYHDDLTRTDWDQGSVVARVSKPISRSKDSPKAIAKLTLDFNISPLPAGLVFGPNTYLGRQLLYGFLSSIAEDSASVAPNAYHDFGLDFCQTMDLSATCSSVTNILCHWLEKSEPSEEVPELDRHENLMQNLAKFVASLLSNDKGTTEADLDSVSTFLKELRHRIAAFKPSHDTDIRLLCILWFIIEVQAIMLKRCNVAEQMLLAEKLTDNILHLMRGLLAFGLQRTLNPIIAHGGELNNTTAALRTAEMWISLIHLVSRLATLRVVGIEHVDSFWHLVLRVFTEDRTGYATDFEASELVWEMIFSFSALSQFSVHGMSTSYPRLTAYWELVTTALKQIRLTLEPSIDGRLSAASLRKRDEYVRLVTARCFLLSHKWEWHLNDAYTMLSQLVEIFKSRKFANLRGEESDFPAFLRHSDLQLLTEIRNTDTAFTLFLKLIVLAGRSCTVPSDDGGQMPRFGMKKLLSLAVPLSGVPFSKESRPSDQDLSMLYNRFSAQIITIYLEPTEGNLKSRIARASGYVNFKNADWKSRHASIRALMHFAILARHFNLPLDEPLGWLEAMTGTLLDEYQEMELPPKPNFTTQAPIYSKTDKNYSILSLQLLLGCVRRIVETSSMDPNKTDDSCYPDPALLEGQWVKRVFASKSLTSIVTTSLEIQKLVLSFLNIRRRVMPCIRRAVLPSMNANGESQDEYGEWDLDYDDPDLIAALETNIGPATVNDNTALDRRVATVMDEDISPAIYRFVIKHFSDESDSSNAKHHIEDYCHDADRWVECWVGCAAVIVYNKRRNWSHYLELGPQSWERISDSSWRRRVGLRFMFEVLRCDPTAYLDHRDKFLQVLLESLVTSKVTIENEYAALLFCVDGFRHPMLQGIPLPETAHGTDASISKLEFTDLRVRILDRIFYNVSEGLVAGAENVAISAYLLQTWVGFILTSLSIMREIMESASTNPEDRYVSFCKEVFEAVSRYPTLQAQSRLRSLFAWGSSITLPPAPDC